MRIAMLAPISWRTPPRDYGPWELVASMLTEGLVKQGVDVTLFATGDSITDSKLVSVSPKGYSEDPSIDAKVVECLHISEVFEGADDFDLIHNHFDYLPLSYSKLVKTPVLTTIHGFSSEKILAVYRKYNRHGSYVSISDANRHLDLSYVATVYHGLPMGEFSLSEKPEDYLLFYGRIHPDKGTAEAIEVAHKTGRRLIIAGIIQDQVYYREKVEPHLGKDGIEYIGAIGKDRRKELLGNAAATLHLINFNEPFGLSVVESMACGTPVIAVNRGSMPELIVDGKTGFLCANVADAINRVDSCSQLDRKAIRQHVESKFSQEAMVSNYLRVYEQIIAGNAGKSA